ncbi:MAG: TRAP-type C4-dicarboxylate transport system permease small subunit [Phenylobacterium sp.]|jgi:TRAP-type C4-dicarboxylate transport system permease small subunit
MKTIRNTLDNLYLVSGGIAALSLVVLLMIIIAQMFTRWFGITMPGLTAYAGYCMGSTSFFALGYAFSKGSHIRVNLFLKGSGVYRHWVDIWCLAISSVITLFFSYYAIKTTYWSYQLQEISQAQDATPIWIPQIAMSVGTAVLAIAMIDRLVQALMNGKDVEPSANTSDNNLDIEG